MNKKLLISLISFAVLLLISLAVFTIVFNLSKSRPDPRQYFSVSTWTATSSGSQGPITYSIKHVPEGYVYSMSGSFGTVWATTTSTINPFTACSDQFNTTKPEIKNNQSSSTQDWINFNSANYGFSMKYPKDWILREEKLVNDFHGVSLTKNGVKISISEKNGYENVSGGRNVCNQGDYYQIKMGDEQVARPKLPEIYEIGTQKFFPICRLSDGGCSNAIRIKDNDYIFAEYLLTQGNSFDFMLVDDMDKIIGTIQSVK